jgi:hypothetical protein
MAAHGAVAAIVHGVAVATVHGAVVILTVERYLTHGKQTKTLV